MAKPSTAYPFVTRREIGARLKSDPAFLKECAAVLQARTEQRTAGSAPAGKAYGWMSSERVVAGRLVAKSRIGMLSEEEELKLGALASRYPRQLADHFRGLDLAENPGLSEAAAKFGVGPTASDPSDIVQGPRDPQERAERCHSSGESQPDGLEDAPETAPDPVQADELAPRAMEFVERLPGQRTDAIAKALDTTTAMLAPTLRMLVQARKLRKQGVGRGTRYFVRS